MTKRDELMWLVAALPDSEIDAVLADLRLRVTMAPMGGDLDADTQAWLDASATDMQTALRSVEEGLPSG